MKIKTLTRKNMKSVIEMFNQPRKRDEECMAVSQQMKDWMISENNKGGDKMKHKKSLTGWTDVNWFKDFAHTHIGICVPDTYRSKVSAKENSIGATEFVKVKVTIEEVK